jgi:hypothetical protein
MCQQGQDLPAERGGGTTVRPGPARDDDELGEFDPSCSANTWARIRIRRIGSDRYKETNLDHGVAEVVIPDGYTANAVFRPGPNKTGPYSGTLVGSWRFAPGRVFTGKVTGDRDALIRGWQTRNGPEEFEPGNARPVSQQHSITAHWTAQSGVECDQKPQVDFVVTFAAAVAPPPELDLAGYVAESRAAGYGPGDTTRVRPGTPRFRNDYVVLPITYYWNPDPDCCGITNPRRKVIQFARAAIHGPNGRLAKRWTLDILPEEARDTPDHDPTYTGNPGSDTPENPTPGGAGGTQPVGDDLLQWDAPGMPKDLYDKLVAAGDPSTYRQQFLSILVCRAPGGPDRFRVAGYLAQGRVRHVMVTTIRWDFPGQRQPNPPNGSRNPVITVHSAQRDGGCAALQAFLEVNGLIEELRNPNADARALQMLDRPAYAQTLEDVEAWEQDPFGHLQFP